ncbi:hypothetical protein C8Q74DRAFT_1370286 [Fomes fomentarius]|nr:hypothetical protein C8Q74DRAFT_1370286 [Fomes fomentarius]
MVRLSVTALAGLSVYSMTSLFAQAAPASRRQLGNLECNIDRGEIVFHVATLGATAAHLANATGLTAANGTVEEDVQAIKDGAEGAGAAIKQILIALVNNEAAGADLRDAVGGNLTQVSVALGDLASSDNRTSALLQKASQQLTNAALAGDGVVNNCK